MLVDRSQRPNSVLSDISVSVVKTGLGSGEQGFDQFRFSQFGEEAKGIPTDEFVGMLKVIPDAVTCTCQCHHSMMRVLQILPDQYHLLLQLSTSIQLRTDLVVEVQEFLERLAL